MAYQGTEVRAGNLESRSANSVPVDIGMEMGTVVVEILKAVGVG